jgi:hypothetical protein
MWNTEYKQCVNKNDVWSCSMSTYSFITIQVLICCGHCKATSLCRHTGQDEKCSSASHVDNIVICQWLDRGFGLVIRFVRRFWSVTTGTSNYNSFTDRHPKPSIFTSRCLLAGPNVVLFRSCLCRPLTISQLMAAANSWRWLPSYY